MNRFLKLPNHKTKTIFEIYQDDLNTLLDSTLIGRYFEGEENNGAVVDAYNIMFPNETYAVGVTRLSDIKSAGKEMIAEFVGGLDDFDKVSIRSGFIIEDLGEKYKIAFRAAIIRDPNLLVPDFSDLEV